MGGKLEYSVIANGTYSVVMCVLLKNLAHHFALYKIIGVFIFLSVSLCFFLTVSQKVLNKAFVASAVCSQESIFSSVAWTAVRNHVYL